MKYPLILFFLVLFFVGTLTLLSGQTTVIGDLVQDQNNEPLPYATLIVYSTSDSAMVANALTEDDGSFSFEVPAGRYYAILQYIGFEDGVIENIDVKPGVEKLDLGTIALLNEAVALEEVEIVAE
jgi:hypothetical protein